MNYEESVKKIKAFTDDELRMGIASYCGWVKPHEDIRLTLPTDTCWISPLERTDCGECWGVGTLGFAYEIPNYTSDLNAMYEAEELAHFKDMHYAEKWLVAIALIISDGDTDDYINIGKWNMAHASARQRAETFMLTIHLFP